MASLSSRAGPPPRATLFPYTTLFRSAERPGQADQSWYSVLAPYPNPRVVVTVTVERGGFGVDSAAPVAAGILSQYFHTARSEEHTSELQSLRHLVCRLLLEKKKHTGH